ncbi:MAG: DUF72 domain-containing protein [Candidatus Binatia bacterium]
MPELRIGTSGYQYDHWKGIFYPHELPKKSWFGYYADHFDTVEINNTFYRLPEARAFDTWRRQAPKGFCYALKLSRYGTHLKRLKDPKRWITNFTGRAKKLRETLGPILVQLPPNWDVNFDRLEIFLKAAPSHYRWAFEFRDPRWLRAEIYGILKSHKAALCIHDMIEKHPREITAKWVYLRFHGIRYGGNYTHQFLKEQALQIKTYLDRGLDVFAYFNNDRDGYALQNAAELENAVRETGRRTRRSWDG